MASPLVRAAQSAIKAATSLGATKSGVLRHVTSEYDPDTGANVKVTTDYPWVGVLESYTTTRGRGGTDLDGNVLTTDKRWTGAAADIPVDVSPETDKLVVDGKTLTIVNAKTDPASALWVLQVRR